MGDSLIHTNSVVISYTYSFLEKNKYLASKTFLNALQPPPPMGQVLVIMSASRSYSDTPHSVVLLWTSDQPVPDNTQHSQERNIHAPGGIRTPNPSKRDAADPRLRPRSQWECQNFCEALFLAGCNQTYDPSPITADYESSDVIIIIR